MRSKGEAGLRGMEVRVFGSRLLEKVSRKTIGSVGGMQSQGKTNLIVQHQEQGAAYTQVPWSLYLEPICLLGCGCPVPLSREKS